MPAEITSSGAVDFTHLDRMTCGDKALERDVLKLFDGQAATLLADMERAGAASAAPLAHTLCGSARGIGAWKLAAAAEDLELAANLSDPARFEMSLKRLASMVEDVRAAIWERLKP
jgi:HPt (histidine-containing phosphotransfer) domain-containing protein